MISVLILFGILVLMICALLAPSVVNDFMRSGIPVEVRPGPPKYPFFPVILIFLLGIGIFYEIGHYWPEKQSIHFDSMQYYLSRLGAFILAATGVFACLWPFQFMRTFVLQLRHASDNEIDASGKSKIVFVARAFGTIFLLASSFVVHLILNAK